MTIRLGRIVISCADIELMTRFWAQALDRTPEARRMTSRCRAGHA